MPAQWAKEQKEAKNKANREAHTQASARHHSKMRTQLNEARSHLAAITKVLEETAGDGQVSPETLSKTTWC